MIIAIDGPAGAGKSTTARAVARELNFDYIDTGAMYRAIALVAHENKWHPEHDADVIAQTARDLPIELHDNGTRTFIARREISDLIRTPQIAALTSQISALPLVRAAMVELQRRLGRQGEANCGGAVLEGRDIQTVVFPDAELKIFLSADTHTRATRRVAQWQESGQSADIQQTAREIEERDARDSSRETAPLQAAPDATQIATDDFSSQEVVQKIVELARARM